MNRHIKFYFIVCLSWLLLGSGSALAGVFKGENFLIDLPPSYQVTVYRQPSEVTFLAKARGGGTVSVIVQKNPFINKEVDGLGEKRMHLAQVFIETLTQRIGDPVRGQVIYFMDGDMKIGADRTVYRYRWSYRAREPKEEDLDMITYQIAEGPHLYTITLAAWRPQFAHFEKEFEVIAESFMVIENPEIERTPATVKKGEIE